MVFRGGACSIDSFWLATHIAYVNPSIASEVIAYVVRVCVLPRMHPVMDWS